MPAVYESGPTTDIIPAPAHDRIAARREALTALGSFVPSLLQDKLRLPFTFARPTVALTAYDEVYRRSQAGGHWTLAGRWTGLLSHTVASYTVALHFDEQDRASHFVISGAQTVVTRDATPESLARGLDAAARGGPLITWGPNLPPGISL